MTHAVAVIGANFGDEGKGLMVDHFSALRPDSLVIRYNGGAQAGHTVHTPDGKRHVFQHFGAGSFVGCPTYLSSFFLNNPILWEDELHRLKSLNVEPVLYVHPRSRVTTPYDMLINREIEIQRGTSRHGSVGVGINETVERSDNMKFRLLVQELLDKDSLRKKLENIRDKWVPKRLAALKIEKPSDWFVRSMSHKHLFEGFLRSSENFVQSTRNLEDEEISEWKSVIFEGAQGLCLDEMHKFAPHVTRSKTGLSNISGICNLAGIKDLEVVYTTRAYLTRHGNGPHPTYDPSLSYEDETNCSNDWQGSMRFGPLDVDLLKESIRDDLRKKQSLNVRVSLAMTCVNQVGEKPTARYQGKLKEAPVEGFPKLVGDAVGATKVYVSRRKSRKA